MDVDAFNACQAQPGVFDFLFQSQNGIQFPDISGRGVIQRGDHAGHAGDLADLLQGNGVEAASVPSQSHLHKKIPSLSQKPFLSAAVSGRTAFLYASIIKE